MFAVLDVETTGLSPEVGDRVVEIAILRLRPDGVVTDEFTTLVNPQRDVGPSWVHGLLPDDVATAPTFHEIAGDVLARLRGMIVVAHNTAFDLGFLSAELTAEGVFLPVLPSLCTLKLSYRLHPTLLNHKLTTCCEAAGVEETGSHSAMNDARITERLLMTYIGEAGKDGMTIEQLLGAKLAFPPSWPSIPSTRRVVVRSSRSEARVDPPYLARLVTRLALLPADEALAPYLDLLDRALADRRVTPEEAVALQACAVACGLTAAQAMEAHYDYMNALVVAALSDDVITDNERRDLVDVASLLGIPLGTLDALISSHRSGESDRTRTAQPAARPAASLTATDGEEPR